MRVEVNDGQSVHVELMYPSRDQQSQAHVSVGLEHVRAADSIRITYDFDRDGWVIWQASKFEFEAGDPLDERWREAAFCQAWQFDDRPEEAR